MNYHIEYFKKKGGKKYREGETTKLEKKLIKSMLNYNIRNQDILYIINYGRETTINSARIDDVIKKDDFIEKVCDNELEKYISKINHIKEISYRLKKSREAMINAIQIFNNPSMEFKYESFCVFSQIAWLGLLQEIMAENFGKDSINNNKNDKKLSLTQILKKLDKELKEPIKENILKIKELRNLVEHDIYEVESINRPEINGVIQANIINFNKIISKLDIRLSLEEQLSFSLQFGGFNKEKVISLQDSKKTVINSFCESIKNNNYNDNVDFCFGIYYGKMSTSKNNADRVEIVDGSDTSENIIKVIQEKVSPKYRPTDIVNYIQGKGFKNFKIHNHTNLWQEDEEKFRDEKNKYGAMVSVNWLWNEKWKQYVLKTLKEREEQKLKEQEKQNQKSA
ncbi:MAG: DUF3644 domain-containing protein [Alphaproteobacteria bacterium]|nr:DUF3644 domain-containing protein [Alphaproteobacteria bacterium]